MNAILGQRGRMPPLTDRSSERAALDRLVDAVRAGESQALVVRGDPGVGKTVLLDHLAEQASGSGCRVARSVGMQSEMELAFAGLHQLCAPMLNRAERLPVPQRDALRTAFGIAEGPPPDRFLVGLAVLSLLAGVAGERPLICVIDDEQWLDQASAQALGFAARRLAADPVGLVFAARDPSVNVAGLPGLEIDGLRDDDARALLDSMLAGPLASGLGSDAPPLLLKAAGRLEPFDLDLARETYLSAVGAAQMAGHLAGQDILLEICRAVQALPPPSGDPRPLDLLLDGLALLTIDGPAAASPTLQRAAAALAEIPVEDVLRWGWMATTASALLWDFEGMHAVSVRQVQLVRDAAALAQLPLYLSQLGIARPWMGDFAGTASVIAETDGVAAATGSPVAPYTLLRLLAMQGREAEASAPIANTIELAAAGGQGMASAWAHWAAAVLYNGLARYEEAASAARQATSFSMNPWMSM